MIRTFLQDPQYTAITENMVNVLIISGPLYSGWAFGKFDSLDWKLVVDNWDDIRQHLDHGEVPAEFPYDWTNANELVDFAHAQGMSIRGGNLLWGADVPSRSSMGTSRTLTLRRFSSSPSKSECFSSGGRLIRGLS